MKLMLQVALLFGICFTGEFISSFLPVPFPGTVISMIILFVLLVTKIIRVDHIQKKADFLLENMGFFLVPAGVGILGSMGLLTGQILSFAIIVVVSTLTTFMATAFTVQGVMTLQDKIHKNKEKRGNCHE